MTGICMQTENMFYIPFLVFLYSHLQEWLQSANLAAINLSADAHVHKSHLTTGGRRVALLLSRPGTRAMGQPC